MNIYMDDQRSCPFGYVPATTVETALEFVRENEVNIFCKEGLHVKEIHFHTNDVIGMDKMKQRIEGGKEQGEIEASIIVKYVGS
ncbi:cyclic-phosphate processing receiver domain-containing protein [Bacillus toyonensis]|uniref:cyclic-phosphate processing receiver domain-containing protein n=1 Tax=Bacillus toyonensis TaxID=155322 RepID=UPI000BFDCE86|nr:cyclic-phosphate processing receiver domain-containing protein [Bacillus toyonensis]PHB59438.1 hypothetical protein COE91_01360 [Bacillus toyonensis]